MGFEPMNRFWRLHTFQACAFDQLGHLSKKNSEKRKAKWRNCIYRVSLTFRLGCKSKILFSIFKLSSPPAMKPAVNAPLHPSGNRIPKDTSAW